MRCLFPSGWMRRYCWAELKSEVSVTRARVDGWLGCECWAGGSVGAWVKLGLSSQVNQCVSHWRSIRHRMGAGESPYIVAMDFACGWSVFRVRIFEAGSSRDETSLLVYQTVSCIWPSSTQVAMKRCRVEGKRAGRLGVEVRLSGWVWAFARWASEVELWWACMWVYWWASEVELTRCTREGGPSRL